MDLIEFETAPSPQTTLIVLHGLGADGADMQPVCEALALQPLGPVRFVLPNAPERPVTLNGGYRMRAWYDILGLDGAGGEDETGLRQSLAAVQALVEREMARGVASQRIVLMGFSQGCAMALLSGLRCPHRLGGLAGLSGYLPLAGLTANEQHTANANVPIFLAHGRNDPVVRIERAKASLHTLQALGRAPTWHDYPMEHTINLDELGDLQRWLLGTLPPSP